MASGKVALENRELSVYEECKFSVSLIIVKISEDTDEKNSETKYVCNYKK